MVKKRTCTWQAYVRSRDENIQADDVMVAFWQKMKKKKVSFIRYCNIEKTLFELLEQNEAITLKNLARAPESKTKSC
jgi:hypothetical protein